MSNRVKARLTVMVGLLLYIIWQLVMQQAALASRIPFPTLLPEQVMSVEDVEIVDCSVAIGEVHTEPLSTPSPEMHATVVLTDERAALLVRSVATAYLQRDYHLPARVGLPALVVGEFFGETRIAWGQVWQPPGFDGTFAGTDALVVYVDAVAAVPLAIYTDLPMADEVTGCLLPTPQPSLEERLNNGLPIILGLAVMLIAFGGLLELRTRSVVAVSE